MNEAVNKAEKMRKSKDDKYNLSPEFSFNSFLYELADQPYPNIFIYHVNKSHYEVFYTTKNRLPKDEDFGISAHCCINLELARKKAKVIKQRVDINDKALSKY